MLTRKLFEPHVRDELGCSTMAVMMFVVLFVGESLCCILILLSAAVEICGGGGNT